MATKNEKKDVEKDQYERLEGSKTWEVLASLSCEFGCLIRLVVNRAKNEIFFWIVRFDYDVINWIGYGMEFAFTAATSVREFPHKIGRGTELVVGSLYCSGSADWSTH